ncbi:hypothetical protein [Pinibacter soli]|uniref:Uncharacterized protein n=1 Tax=Pinibacter soli TaxID=3044211 RepID=A0ABT6RCC2_9BACT|nr:hypothetical protein [Pinibacter soli]MDI3320216.1 hypothetical protein [Pinibacter soli]
MKAKERLLKLHEEKNKITVNNKNSIHIASSVSFDTDKLTPKEKARLEELLAKAQSK